MKKNITLLIFCFLLSYKSQATNWHASIFGNSIFCQGDSSHLYVYACPFGCTLTSAQWYLNSQPIPGATDFGYATNIPGLYSCNVGLTTCIYGGDSVTSGMTDTFRVYGYISATITLLTDTNVCHGDSVIVKIDKTGPGSAYQWGVNSSFSGNGICSGGSWGNSMSDTLFVTDGLNLSCSLTTNVSAATVTASLQPYSGGCMGGGALGSCVSKTFQLKWLDNNKQQLQAAGSNPFCSGDSLNLTIGSLLSIPGQTYQWKRNSSAINGAINNTYGAKLNGNYFAVVSYAQGCSANTDTISVTVNPSPQPVVTLVSGNLWQVTQSFIDYQWYKNDTLIPGANQSSYNVGSNYSPDFWYVIVTDDNGCTGKSSLIAITGIANVSPASFGLYPNPATNQLFIETTGTPIEQINIYNTTGNLILQTKENKQSMDISPLASGIYMAEIKTKEASVKKRWVKM